MWCRVDFVWIDVSEERIASIFRVEKSASFAGQWTLGSLTPSLLGQCSLHNPASPPRQDSIPSLACYLLAHLHRSFPVLSIDFPRGPLSLPSSSYIAGCFRLVAQSAATCSRWFLARGFFYHEDGGDMFLRNVGLHKTYTAPHSRRRHSS
jgi:hypothetical protein